MVHQALSITAVCVLLAVLGFGSPCTAVDVNHVFHKLPHGPHSHNSTRHRGLLAARTSRSTSSSSTPATAPADLQGNTAADRLSSSMTPDSMNRLVSETSSLSEIQSILSARLTPPLERKCGAPVPSAEIQFEHQARISSPQALQTPFSNAAITVYWHVITDAVGNGNVQDSQIQDSIKALNKAYNRFGFSFNLATIDRNSNSQWFYNLDPSNTTAVAIETAMKQGISKGGLQDLNVYTLAPNKGYLGWSYMPQTNAGPLDGVIIHYGTLPGGSLQGFNLGYTLVHEVSHGYYMTMMAVGTGFAQLRAEHHNSLPTTVTGSFHFLLLAFTVDSVYWHQSTGVVQVTLTVTTCLVTSIREESYVCCAV